MKSLFTYIFEFRGGTYTSQLQSSDLQSSIQDWFKKLQQKYREIEHLEPKTVEEIQNELIGEEPIPLEGLVNTWSLGIDTIKGFGLVTIVKTEGVESKS